MYVNFMAILGRMLAAGSRTSFFFGIFIHVSASWFNNFVSFSLSLLGVRCVIAITGWILGTLLQYLRLWKSREHKFRGLTGYYKYINQYILNLWIINLKINYIYNCKLMNVAKALLLQNLVSLHKYVAGVTATLFKM